MICRKDFTNIVPIGLSKTYIILDTLPEGHGFGILECVGIVLGVLFIFFCLVLCIWRLRGSLLINLAYCRNLFTSHQKPVSDIEVYEINDKEEETTSKFSEEGNSEHLKERQEVNDNAETLPFLCPEENGGTIVEINNKHESEDADSLLNEAEIESSFKTAVPEENYDSIRNVDNEPQFQKQ